MHSTIGVVALTGAAERSKKWGAEAGGRDEWGVGVFDKEYQSAPVNCKADRLSAFCANRAKMCTIPTRCDKRRQWAFSAFTSDHIWKDIK